MGWAGDLTDISLHQLSGPRSSGRNAAVYSYGIREEAWFSASRGSRGDVEGEVVEGEIR